MNLMVCGRGGGRRGGGEQGSRGAGEEGGGRRKKGEEKIVDTFCGLFSNVAIKVLEFVNQFVYTLDNGRL